MPSRPLRFVQAGDFLLHQPMRGLMDVPDHLAARLVEAPYQAAERAFDAALAEEVDFVLLCGNLCDPHRSGPRGLVFLTEQFARLTQRGIAVYWAADCAAGREAAEDGWQSDWPMHQKWPSGVHVFSAARLEHLVHHRDGKPLCQIAGRSSDGPASTSQSPLTVFSPNPAELPGIAIIAGDPPSAAENLPAVGNCYWACGGRTQSTALLSEIDSPCVVHFSGSPQGRVPQDLGPAGCTLVAIDVADDAAPENRVRLSPIPTDAVRWHDERLHLPGSFDRVEYERLLHERMGNLIAAAPDRMHLVRWCIDASHPDAERSKQSSLAAELLAMLRSEYGFRDPPAWSASLSLVPPELPASWAQQKTLLGEFLRRIGELETSAAEENEADRAPELAVASCLDCFLSDEQRSAGLAELVGLGNFAQRTNVLRQAADLGAALLAPNTAAHSRGAESEPPRSNSSGSPSSRTDGRASR